jgi:2-C-methyl-D-erythritol 2,4-cyclodiphosphate synthase
MGFDAHPFAEGRALILGGVEIPHSRGLSGHSDADALLHAIGDAILGALGLEDIGHHFPDDDPSWKDIPSSRILASIRGMMTEKGYFPVNVDAVIIAQEPKLAPYIPRMRENIGHLLEIPRESVGLKATTTEGLGFTGRREGLSAAATVLLTSAGDSRDRVE